MSNTIELMCGPSNNEKLLSVSIPENDNPLNKILVGFTGGLDSAFLLYLLTQLNSTQTIPYVIEPVIITGYNIFEQLEYVPAIINYINIKNNHSMSPVTIVSTLTDRKTELISGYITALKSSSYVKFLYLGASLIPRNAPPAGYARNFPTISKKLIQPFKNLDKTHIIDAMIKLNLEDLIDIAPRCTVTHKYGNEACLNYFCTERRWAYSILNRLDLTNKFIGKDT